MQNSEKIALAAHLHVLLRRKTGRVTDTEWMVANADYTREIVRYAKAQALERQDPELESYARKLEASLLPAASAPAPLASGSALERLRERAAAPAARPGAERPAAPRYVGGLR